MPRCLRDRNRESCFAAAAVVDHAIMLSGAVGATRFGFMPPRSSASTLSRSAAISVSSASIQHMVRRQ
jgi:hypothetical protein